MDFRFNVNDFLKNKITKVNNTLLPEKFSGDRRSAGLCSNLLAEVVDEMGLASAKAQGLLKPITSAERLRNSEHVVYLLAEPEGNNGKGSVVGLLKMGQKNLFIFDATGLNHEKMSLCVLDFYVHESRQRKGYGKILFEHMLREENTVPHRLAIDKPSEKFLAFLYKHYGLSKIIPQTNNFVIFDGFFYNDCKQSIGKTEIIDNGQVTEADNLYKSVSRQSYGDYHHIRSDDHCNAQIYGRQPPYKPLSTIGKIVQSSPSTLETTKRSGRCRN
ncbi:alpha-tubulin N-acetyltransferase-like isoform X2 [Lycorma delicatula]|uniref:alpha-tubulin N-acetyltransferase-like isoform X2 n=1 Tax=Lycorma delicatula TaxID=130591 RepID=UPI003F512B8A